MRPSSRSQLLAQVAGLFLYVVGMVLLLVVVVGVILGVRDGGLDPFSPELVPYLLGGIVLVVGGRLVAWRFGGGYHALTGWVGVRGQTSDAPEKSPLEELGYQDPTTHEPPEEGERATAGSPSTLVCPECGVENEPVFTYCENCAAELPS